MTTNPSRGNTNSTKFRLCSGDETQHAEKEREGTHIKIDLGDGSPSTIVAGESRHFKMNAGELRTTKNIWKQLERERRWLGRQVDWTMRKKTRAQTGAKPGVARQCTAREGLFR